MAGQENEIVVSSDEVDFRTLRAGIRKEIRACIRPHLTANELPPFTVPELFVMAILSSNKEALTFPELMKWIVTTFQYYRSLALDQYVECGTYDERSDESPYNVVEGFSDGFACWEAPLYDPDGISIVSYSNDCLFSEVTVPIPRGRIFLRRWLEPKRSGSFPFFKLPPELRTTIYEMVFSLPATRIYVEPARRGHGLVPSQRELDNFSKDYLRKTLNVVNDLKTASMQYILALLSVNKQIYSEALPYFYRLNAFDFHDIESFVSFVRNVPVERLQHLRKVSLSFDKQYYYGYVRPGSSTLILDRLETAMRSFSSVRSLQELDFKTDDRPWFEMPGYVRKALGRSSKYNKAQQLPGLKGLAIAASKAQVLGIQGDCPRIKEYLEAEAERLKGERLKMGTASISKPRKRVGRSKAAVKST